MNLRSNLQIGIRNIKTALAITVAVILSNTIGFQSPFLSAMSALLVMEASIKDTFKSGKDRILATILGAVISYLLCLLKPGDIFLTALGIIIIIFVSTLLDWYSSIPTAGIIFLSIMFGIKDSLNPLEYSLLAISQTFLGIVVAFIINFIIAPPNHIPSVLQSYQVLRDRASFLIEKRLFHNESIDTFGFYDMIEELSDTLNTLLKEIRLSRDKPLHADNIKKIILLYKHIYFHLTVLNDTSESVYLSKENSYKFKSVYGKLPKNSSTSSKEENIVFNYHAGKILDALISLQGLRITREKK